MNNWENLQSWKQTNYVHVSQASLLEKGHQYLPLTVTITAMKRSDLNFGVALNKLVYDITLIIKTVVSGSWNTYLVGTKANFRKCDYFIARLDKPTIKLFLL